VVAGGREEGSRARVPSHALYRLNEFNRLPLTKAGSFFLLDEVVLTCV